MSEWVAASRALGLQVHGAPLVPNVVSAMVQTFLAEPELAAPIEYLLRFHEVPVEMRGAFLSVSLESLTDQMQKKGGATMSAPRWMVQLIARSGAQLDPPPRSLDRSLREHAGAGLTR